MSKRPIRRALVSVYDKTGLDDLGKALADAGVQVVSTGSTAGRLRDAGVDVTGVEEVTGFPECLDGRVKTLHPKVHAGILADLRKPDHEQQLRDLEVEPFDLVVVNLYPFADTVASGAGPDECVEQIDIGGPSMVRAAAKNHPSVAVVVEPAAYPAVVEALRDGGFTLEERKQLAAQAFAHTAAYDVAVASWFASAYAPDQVAAQSQWPAVMGALYERADVLRYGENPHQRAALFRNPHVADGLAQAEQLHGKQMSYNNYVDTDAALRAANDFAAPCVAVIKHANPCGIATGADVAAAHRKAHACDPVSAFGGVIAANRPVSTAMAEQVAEIFTEVIVAPDYEPGAVELLARKPSIRVLRTAGHGGRGVELRQICGGLVVQSADALDAPGDDPATWTLQAGAAVDEATMRDLVFAWRACRSVKSNAILLATDEATVGIGMGQVNRVDAARLAVSRAGDRAARLRRGERRVLPVPGRSRGAGRRAGCARSSSPAAPFATRPWSRPPGRPASPCTSPAPVTSSTRRVDPPMSARLLPGEPVAQAVFDDLVPRIKSLVASGHTPGLGTILVGDDSASAGYIRMKQEKALELGLTAPHVHLPADAAQADLVAAIRELNADPAVDAMLVQHPTPPQIDFEAALAEMDPDKDVDGLHPMNMGRLALGMPGPVPCTPAGIEALLAFHEVPVAGRSVCILGRGTTLGRPLALLLTQKRPTANAAVTVVHTGVPDWADYTRRAEIVIAAAGVPGILQPEHVGARCGGRRWRGALRGPPVAAGRRRVVRRGRGSDHAARGRRRPDDGGHAVPQLRGGRRAARLLTASEGALSRPGGPARPRWAPAAPRPRR